MVGIRSRAVVSAAHRSRVVVDFPSMGPHSVLRALLSKTLGEVRALHPLAGGDINQAWRAELTSGGAVFVKYNSSAPLGMFEAEAKGLEFLRDACSELVIPQVIAQGDAFLVLELLTRSSEDQAVQLGRGLAMLHRSGPRLFGLDYDNFIGTLPQHNAASSGWATFYRDQRLLYQLSLPGAKRAFDSARRAVFDRLFERLPFLLAPTEPAARLHGDLWGGNWMATTKGPAIFDPAVYGGHREIDLSMMQLFGGFSRATFAAYEEVYPLAAEAKGRVRLYQLYPLLVHTNLFGGGYAEAAYEIAREFV